MARIKPPFTVGFYGTSLTTGRLACSDISWVPLLEQELNADTDARGSYIFYNAGKGSQTSDWGAANAYNLASLRPRLIVFEGFGINDCAIGPVTLVQAAANFDSMVATWRTADPTVDLVHQTMSPAAASDANRTNLQTYYNQEMAKATAAGIQSLNHTPNWPALTALNTNGAPAGDLLHPLFTGVFETASYPAIKALVKSKAAAFWA